MRIIGIIASYIALILLIIMCLKPIFKKLAKHNKIIKVINKFLIKTHKQMGILFIIFIIIHAICSWTSTIKTISAYIACFFVILSILFYFLRKKLPKKWLKLHLIFAIISLLFSLLHIIEVNVYIPFLYEDENNNNVNVPTDKLFDNQYKLIDGEYFGEGIGYNDGKTIVKVYISNGVISNIEIISSDDDAFYIKKAEKSLKAYFIENQSSDVDIIAGASYSSNGYIEAVLAAVEKSKETN